MKALISISLSVIEANCNRDDLDLSDLKPLPYLEKPMLSCKLDRTEISPVFGHFPKLKSLRLCFSGLRGKTHCSVRCFRI
jgi:disease resistance protein RPM1